MADVEAVIKLIADAADPAVELPLIDRKQRVLESLARLVEADAWLWVTGEINSLYRDDSMAVTLLDGGWRDDAERAQLFRALNSPAIQSVVWAVAQNAVSAQRSRTQLREEIVDDGAWQASPAGQAWSDTGFEHFVTSVYPVDGSAYSAVGCYRRRGRPPFCQRERTLVHALFQQVDWLHGSARQLPAFGDVSTLSPRERQVLLLLLEGDSRKQVAIKLNLSAHTVADYLKAIYKKLGVNSRAELLAKFIQSGK